MLRCSSCLKSNFEFVKETPEEVFLKCLSCGKPLVVQKTDYTKPLIEEVKKMTTQEIGFKCSICGKRTLSYDRVCGQCKTRFTRKECKEPKPQM